jgi:hypothetical protein
VSSVRTDRPAPADLTPSRDPGTATGRPGFRAWAGDAFADVRAATSWALAAAALGVVACVGLVVAGWASDPASATPWPQAIRLGVDLWLVAHLGELAVVSEVVTSTSPADPPALVPGVVSLPPLLVVLLAALPAWQVGDRLARRCPPARALLLTVVVAAVHAAVAWALAWAVDTVVVVPSPLVCAVGAAVTAGLAAVLGVLRVNARDVLDLLPRAAAVQLRRVVPAAAVALTAWLLAGSLLLSLGLLTDLATVASVHEQLSPGPLGGVLLLLVQLAYLPTAVVWSAAVVAGPGVAVGSGQLSVVGSTVSDVPAVPLLAALPDPGPFPLWAYLGPLLVVGAGALAGWHAHRHPSSRGATLLDRMADAAAVAALAGIATAALVVTTDGALGPWTPLGPDLLLVAAVTGEVLVGAVVAGGALHLLAGRAIGRPVSVRSLSFRPGRLRAPTRP